jgi:hypothetical protein
MDQDSNNNKPPRVSRWAGVFSTNQAERERKAAWILEDPSSPFCPQYWENRNANQSQQSALAARSSGAITIGQLQQQGVESLEAQPTISPPMGFSDDPGNIFTKSFREKKAQQPRIQNPFGSMLEYSSEAPVMSPWDSRSPSTPFEQEVQAAVQVTTSELVVSSRPAVQSTNSLPEGSGRAALSAINTIQTDLRELT